MLNDKQRWWAEAALDVLATFLIGWLVLGSIVAGIVQSTMIKPGADPGDLVKFFPLFSQIAVTWVTWKLLRAHDWLKGAPPSGG